MYNSNSRSNQTKIQAVVSGEVVIRTTQYGDKAVCDFTLPDGKKATVWDTLDDENNSVLFDLAIGQTVSLFQNTHGNWKVDKGNLHQFKRHLQTVETTQVVVKPVADITLSVTNPEHPARKQARLLRDCIDAVLMEMAGLNLSDELIQKYATTLFISLNK